MRVLIICGSPRKGNSENIASRLSSIFSGLGVENEIIFLRKHNVLPCEGCVEYCNKHYKCKHNDDMGGILKKILAADGLVLVSPNYFGMPPGIFKNFIDKCSVLYTKKYFTGKPDLSAKKAVVIAVGTDKPFLGEMIHNIKDNFLSTLGIETVATAEFITKSELKGNYNELFERDSSVLPMLKEMAEKLVKALS